MRNTSKCGFLRFTSVSLFLGIMFVSGSAQAQSCSTSLYNNAGDIISGSAISFTSDPNENGEGELLISSSSGEDFSSSTSAYEVPQPFYYIAASANETISGSFVGVDGDESCSITAAVNKTQLLSEAQKERYAKVATTESSLSTGTTVAIIIAISGGGHNSDLLGDIKDLIVDPLLAASEKSARLAADPIDPNYTQRAIPITPHIRHLVAKKGFPEAVIVAVNEFADNEARIIGLQKALYISLNRAAGAVAANDKRFVDFQLSAAKVYERQLGVFLNKEARLLVKLQNALQAAGITVTVTPAEVLSYETQLASTGLPARDITMLQKLGESTSDIDYITQLTIVQNISAASGNFPQMLANPTLISLLKSFPAGPPMKEQDCIDDDQWQDYNTPRHFKNQDDCRQFVRTGK